MICKTGELSRNKRKARSGRTVKTTLYDVLDAIDREIKDEQLVRQILMQLLASGKIRFTQNVNREMVFA